MRVVLNLTGLKLKLAGRGYVWSLRVVLNRTDQKPLSPRSIWPGRLRVVLNRTDQKPKHSAVNGLSVVVNNRGPNMGAGRPVR